MTWYYSEKTIDDTQVENIEGSELNIYPNPTSDYISVHYNGEIENATIELIDIQGKMVLSRNLKNDETINLKNLKAGVYLYNIHIDGELQKGKLIKQ